MGGIRRERPQPSQPVAKVGAQQPSKGASLRVREDTPPSSGRMVKCARGRPASQHSAPFRARGLRWSLQRLAGPCRAVGSDPGIALLRGYLTNVYQEQAIPSLEISQADWVFQKWRLNLLFQNLATPCPEVDSASQPSKLGVCLAAWPWPLGSAATG